MKNWRFSIILSVFLMIAATLHHQKQKNDFNSKKRELSDLEAHQTRSDRRRSHFGRTTRSGTSSSTSSRITHLRQITSAPLSSETVSAILSKEAEGYNVETWHEMFLMFANRDQAEITTFLGEIKSCFGR